MTDSFWCLESVHTLRGPLDLCVLGLMLEFIVIREIFEGNVDITLKVTEIM